MASEQETTYASPPTSGAVNDHISIHYKTSMDTEKHNVTTAVSGPFGTPDSPEWRQAEKRLVRKLDMTLMPMVWLLYMFNYLDRNNIACVPFLSLSSSLLIIHDLDKPISTILTRTLA